jgi:hypothetical protein
MMHRPVPFELPAHLLAWLAEVAAERGASAAQLAGLAIATFLHGLEAVAEDEAGKPSLRGNPETVEYVDGQLRRFGDLTGEEMLELVEAYRNRSAALELYAEWLEDFVEAAWGEPDEGRGTWSLKPPPEPPSRH